MDYEGERSRQDLQRDNRWQSECESRLQADQQRSLPADSRRLRTHVPRLEITPVRFFPWGPRKLLRHGDEVRAVKGRRQESIHRPGWLSEIRDPKRAGLSGRTSETKS